MNINGIRFRNNASHVKVSEIPVLNYNDFYNQTLSLLADTSKHCLQYFAVPLVSSYRFFCCIADDILNDIIVYSHDLAFSSKQNLTSIGAKCLSMSIYEREIFENFGIQFEEHPWLKPVRYPFNRSDKNLNLENYPFYKINSNELHEVGVGPIHAGVIEPGHFRFICNGEKVLHLEIQLGYQHRGVEALFIKQNNLLLKQTILSESIAGDTTIGHSLAFTQLFESFAGIESNSLLEIQRCIALELERIAIHIGDTAALCTDIAYQFGQVVNEALRTLVINSLQDWCGNRFGKGLIRVGGIHYPLDIGMVNHITSILNDVDRRYFEAAEMIFNLSSLLSRFEGIGELTRNQAELIGAVGMTARITGMQRDIRKSHPFQYFKEYKYEPVLMETGDVMARALMRKEEVRKSIDLVRYLFAIYKSLLSRQTNQKPVNDIKLPANSFALSMTEGWRGEIVHAAVTGAQGEIISYKVKDPSFHNWMGLALAVRQQEISDFPVCNKSFNLSYCGNDL